MSGMDGGSSGSGEPVDPVVSLRNALKSASGWEIFQKALKQSFVRAHGITTENRDTEMRKDGRIEINGKQV